jgi:hypothetical protein
MRCALLVVGIFAASVTLAQEDVIVGKWSGTYNAGNNRTMRVVLDIKNAEGGKIRGVGSLYSTARRGGQCHGDYPVEGTLKGDELRVRSTEKGGPAGDCTFTLSGKVEGNTLMVKRGQADFEMTK